MYMRGGKEENAEFAEGERQGTRRGKERWGTLWAERAGGILLRCGVNLAKSDFQAALGAVAAHEGCDPRILDVTFAVFDGKDEVVMSLFSWGDGWYGKYVIERQTLKCVSLRKIGQESGVFYTCPLPKWTPVQMGGERVTGLGGGEVTRSRKAASSSGMSGQTELFRLAPRASMAGPVAMRAIGRNRLPVMRCDRCGLWGVAGHGFPMLHRSELPDHVFPPDGTVDAAGWERTTDAVRGALSRLAPEQRANLAMDASGLPLVLPGMEIGPLRVRVLAEPSPVLWLADMTLVVRNDVLEDLRGLGFKLDAVPVDVVECAPGVLAEGWTWSEVVTHRTAADVEFSENRHCEYCLSAGYPLCHVDSINTEALPWLSAVQPLAHVPIQRLRHWYPWLMVTGPLGLELARRFPEACELWMLANGSESTGG